MARRLIPAAFLALSLAVTASAQTTWIVDTAGGPGAHFTDLPPAIAAAADGDVIRVRAGSYSPFSLAGKGLKILGDGGTTVLVDQPGQVAIGPTGAGQPVWIEGLQFAMPYRGGNPAPEVVIAGTAEAVVLNRVSFGHATHISWSIAWSRLRLRDCAQVHLLGSTILPANSIIVSSAVVHGIDARNAFLQVAQSSIFGSSAGSYGSLLQGGAGILVQGGELLVVASSVYGGPGAPGCLLVSAPGGPGGPGIRAWGGARVVVCGRSGTDRVRGGEGGRDCNPMRGYQGDGGHGIELQSATAHFEGLAPEGGPGRNPGAPALLQAGGVLTTQVASRPPIASVHGAAAIPSVVSMRVDAAPGATVFLALALEHRFLPLAPVAIGSWLLAPAPSVLLGPQILPASGLWDLTITLAPGWPLDLPLIGQFIALDGARLLASNTCVVIVPS